MLDVRVAGIAPEREVSKRKGDRMLIASMLILMVEHVTLDIAATLDDQTSWLQADPILAHVPTVLARVVHALALELLKSCDILGYAVWAVLLGNNSVEPVRDNTSSLGTLH